ncbi:MAG: hypothetical protein ACE5DN_06390, partial [Flavobacteriales bacterium]
VETPMAVETPTVAATHIMATTIMATTIMEAGKMNLPAARKVALPVVTETAIMGMATMETGIIPMAAEILDGIPMVATAAVATAVGLGTLIFSCFPPANIPAADTIAPSGVSIFLV